MQHILEFSYSADSQLKIIVKINRMPSNKVMCLKTKIQPKLCKRWTEYTSSKLKCRPLQNAMVYIIPIGQHGSNIPYLNWIVPSNTTTMSDFGDGETLNWNWHRTKATQILSRTTQTEPRLQIDGTIFLWPTSAPKPRREGTWHG
jgi:hypothetical protein